jgi:serine protease Do
VVTVGAAVDRLMCDPKVSGFFPASKSNPVARRCHFHKDVSSQSPADDVYCGVNALRRIDARCGGRMDGRKLHAATAHAPVQLTHPRNWLSWWCVRFGLAFWLGFGAMWDAQPAENRAGRGGITTTGKQAMPALPPPGLARRSDLPEGLRLLAPRSVEQLKTMETHVQELVTRVSPAVVAVRVGQAAGSGVVVSADGLVLSAAHVGGEPGRDVRFTFPDGRTARGETLGTDHGMDAGLMRITDAGPWPFVPLGKPDDAMVGDWVLALGHPGGFDAERPVLVRLGRIIWLTGPVIRTDCTLVSGDSGGPLIDMHGRVIAIHSRISESTTANFHAPVGSYISSWERLAAGENWGARGPRSRSWVGVRGMNHPDGLQLQEVIEGGPAFKAGLRDGDIVMRLNGQPVTDYNLFLRTVSEASPGEPVTLEIRRADEQWEVDVIVEARRRGGGPFGGR